MWPWLLVEQLIRIMGQQALLRSYLCTAEVATSFFSGVGSAEIAWKAVGAALVGHGLPFVLVTGFCCEVDVLCQGVLLAHCVGHVFGDVQDLLSMPRVEATWGFHRKLQTVMAASIRSTARCCRCGRYCAVVSGDIDTSGSPCQDWSAAGSLGRENGKHIHCLLAWVRWHLAKQTPVLVHENVVGFGLDLLYQLMGALYHIIVVQAGPEDVGWPCCRRPRLYIALLHRAKVRMLVNPAWLFEQVCTSLRPNALRIRDCLIAGSGELDDEERELSSMRGHRLTRCWGPGSHLSASRFRRLSHLLSEGERGRLQLYAHTFHQRYGLDPSTDLDLVCNLGDNPGAGWLTWSAPPMRPGCSSPGLHRLPTLRKNWSLQWLPAHGRWLLGSERLVTMGFPPNEQLSRVYGLSGHFRLPWACRNLLGNAMHVANIGVWQACVAASVERI